MAGWLTAAIASVSMSCGFMDLRPVVVETVPAAAYEVLESRDDCLTVVFSSNPERIQAERAFLVKSPAGVVEGDFSWNGPGFTWKPVSPFDPGVRYRLILKGSIGTVDGRDARPEIDLPFFVIRSSAQPAVSSFFPADGSSIAVSNVPVTFLQLVFSEAMDPGETEAALNLKPATECMYSWNTDQTILTVKPENALAACSSYRWSLGTGARALDGTPLGRSESGTFITNLDSTPPRVERVYPVMRSGSAWVESAADISEIDSGHSVAVLFSEPVEPVSAMAGIRMEPGMAGISEAVAPRLIVYTPDRGWSPGVSLTLVVSPDVEDSSGLETGQEYRVRFTPRVPYLMVLTASTGVDETTDCKNGFTVLAADPGDTPDGMCTVTIEFSAPFDAAGKVSAAERISLASFFPVKLPAPALRDICWLSDYSVALSWVGLRSNEVPAIHYYRLLIPGGQGGIISSNGLWLGTDVVLYLEVLD